MDTPGELVLSPISTEKRKKNQQDIRSLVFGRMSGVCSVTLWAGAGKL
jgi:hypothetical protein